MLLAAGTKLGPYEIQSPLGVGGIGEVYRARDTRLDRTVAVKVLSGHLSSNPHQRKHFDREARAISGLQHSHICTLYDVGHQDGTDFLVMEYLDGVTLNCLISRALKIDLVLDFGVQIADALEAAHARGIIHRDIKPTNIFVTRQGQIKLLDFGLARIIEPKIQGLATGTAGKTLSFYTVTEAGIPLGTLAYMSPEQARGETLDPRSDLFSCGAVLYEMATGKPAFAGRTFGITFDAILSHQPVPAGQLNPALPPQMENIIGKALEKDRELRYQSAAEVHADLTRLKRDLQPVVDVRGPSIGRVGTGTRRRANRASHALLPRLAVLAIIIIAALIAQWLSRTGRAHQMSFEGMKISRLTASGNVQSATLSPDGKYVSYVTEDGGKYSIWLRQIAAPGAVQIVGPSDLPYDAPVFSPDGTNIYYLRQVEQQTVGDLYKVSALGGTPLKVIHDVDSPVTFSPDGQHIAFARNRPEEAASLLITAKPDGKGERVLAKHTMGGLFSSLAWSPDGKKIACTIAIFPPSMYSIGFGRTELVLVSAETGAITPIPGPNWRNVGSVAWSGEGSGLVLSGEQETSGSGVRQLWYLAYPTRELRRISNDLNDYSVIAVASDHVAAVESEVHSSIYVVPTGQSARAQQISAGSTRNDGAWGLDWTPDDKLVYTSGIAGRDDLWVMAADGSHVMQLTANAGQNIGPSVTPDGRSVLFASTRIGGKLTIWRMDIESGETKQLTSVPGDMQPRPSGDGRLLVYASPGPAKPHIMKVPINGGEPAPVSEAIAMSPAVSPDANWIAFYYLDVETQGGMKIGITRFDGGPVQTLPVPSDTSVMAGLSWSRDGRALLHVETHRGVDNVFAQPISGGLPRQLTRFGSDHIFSFALSQRGKQLAVAHGTISSDVVLITFK